MSAPDPSPFDFAPAAADEAVPTAAVLCLHGLSGTPYEVRPVGEAAAAAGLRAVGPVLPGHEEGPERLARVRHEAWLEAAREGVAALRAEHPQVFVVGLSMGGAVALSLAAEARVDAVVAIGTPLRLRPGWLRHGMGLFKRVRPYQPKQSGSDIQDAAARARHPSMNAMPLAAVHELVRMQRRLERQLARVVCPLLVVHGALDETAHPDDAHEIVGEVGSPERQLWLAPRSGHICTVDHDGPQVARTAAGFLARRVTAAR